MVGLKPILRTTTSLSALTLLVGSFDPYKPVPNMTYSVFSGTLNAAQSICDVMCCVGAAEYQHCQSRHCLQVTDSCVL